MSVTRPSINNGRLTLLLLLFADGLVISVIFPKFERKQYILEVSETWLRSETLCDLRPLLPVIDTSPRSLS